MKPQNVTQIKATEQYFPVVQVISQCFATYFFFIISISGPVLRIKKLNGVVEGMVIVTQGYSFLR